MKHYYLNLPKDKDLDLNKDLSVSTAIQKTAEEAFRPFEDYLKNAVHALKKKNDVTAKWDKIKSDNLAELKLEGYLFEIPIHKNRYKILVDNGFCPDYEENIICKFDNRKEKITITEADYEKRCVEFDYRVEKFDSVTWAGDSIKLELIQEDSKLSGTIIKEDGQRIIVYVKDKKERNLLPENKKEIQGEKLSAFINFEELKFDNGSKFSFLEHNGLSLTLKNGNDYDKNVFSGNLVFTIERPKKRDKDFYWIQLAEIDDSYQGEDTQIFSPLRYFFDDDIEINDDNGNTYEVAEGRENEYKLVLRKKGEKYKYCFPEGEVLKVKFNTYQLEKQLEAITTLRTMPVGNHINLIYLFNNREKTNWRHPQCDSINDWEVIKDATRSGCYEQREFVNKALNTPDFAILEGPPGSGKTTVILELICQIIKNGGRILLCGSTHVAIDNVLERLKEKRDEGESLLDKFNILPVRIGDENRINDDVRMFQIDNLIEDNDISEDFLLDAANLVCGTTIGILKNPKFRNREKNAPIVPEFDYLIIDESSKTTFQEFLVPALYAKKWILAGDVMQLSPFTDRGEIVSNISQVRYGEEPLDVNLQQACFYLQKLKDCIKGRYNKYIIPVGFETLKYIFFEIESRKEDYEDKLIYIIQNENYKDVCKLQLAAYDIVFIDRNLIAKCREKFPETHVILLQKEDDWLSSQHAFEHNCWQQKHRFNFRNKGKDITDSFEIAEHINGYFAEKNWAEEIAWRIDREHQLRLVKGRNKSKNYSDEITDLLPKTVDNTQIEENINQIAAMAFPSILESLVHGIKGRKNKVQSTISEGFYDSDLRYRRQTLVYQHRMHPEISQFPRERFYSEGKALQDLVTPIPISKMRKWNFSRYPKHRVWIDVKGETNRNYNEQEVKILISHLKVFIEFAKNNPQPEGRKWTVACLTFYRGQETKIREKLRELTGKENAFSDFNIEDGKINIKLHTVDKFQGHEADIVFLSMVQTRRDGFMDNPNRLNVAITRAKFQLVIIGDHNYYLNKSKSDDLKQLAEQTTTI